MRNGPAKEERAFGRRATDRWTVPLCCEIHPIADRAGERNEEASLFQAWGIENVYDLAADLWNAPNDPRVMKAIILAHKCVRK